jgi:hypothetical protein
MSPKHATLGVDGKVPADQLPAGQGGAAWGGITGTLSEQTDLDTALGNKVDTADSRLSDARTPLTHAHAAVDITGTAVVTNDARLSDARTPTAHGHSENILHSLATAASDFLVASGSGAFIKKTLAEVKTILGLATDYLGLHAKADTAGAADTAVALATGADRTKLDGITAGAQANADITKAEIEAKLTGAIASHTHSGGSDPWTYVILASDFPTSSATAVPVTGLAFTPALNKKYEFEGKFMLRTATATVGPRPGLGWPTGMTDGVASLWMTSSATAQTLVNGNINAALLNAVGGLPNNTQSYPAFLEGMVVAGATPSGTVKVNLASETAGTIVTMKAGSFIKYREVV